MNKPIITGDTIKVPSSTDHLADVDLFVEGLLRGWGTDESIIADIAISVSELVNNAIIHGNKVDLSKSVTVKVVREDDTAAITITDHGAGFDPACIADPIADENLLKEVGRGIFIVKSLMDSVEFGTTADGSMITIKKAI